MLYPLWLYIGNNSSHVASKVISNAEDLSSSFFFDSLFIMTGDTYINTGPGWKLLREDMDSSNKALTIMDSRTVNRISVIKPLLLRAYLEEAFNSMIIVAITVFRPTIWASDCLRGKALSPIANSAII